MRIASRPLAFAPLLLSLLACSEVNPNGPDPVPDPEGPRCPREQGLCSAVFTYPFRGESSVEVRGDFDGAASWQKGVPMTRDDTGWRATLQVPLGQPVQYKLCVNGCQRGEDWKLEPGAPTIQDSDGNVNNLRQATICSPHLCRDPGPTPAGVFDWRDAVIYFAFVDRFFDGRADNNCRVPGVSGDIANYMGGDWAGITQKMDYFKELGINALWLTVPVQNTHEAGKGTGGDARYYSGYHGYWPKDMDQPESCFGTLRELQDLMAAAHQRNIQVLFDYAMVHVHASSPVYQQNRGWFWDRYKDGRDCICGQGCDWNADGKRCWFTDYLPHFNFGVPQARDFSVSNALRWIEMTGADGLRLDAIKHVEDSWLTGLRARIKGEVLPKRPAGTRFYLVGETYDFSNRELLRSFIDPAQRLDGQFDFPLRLHLTRTVLMRKAGMNELSDFMRSNDGFYGSGAVMSTFIGNHDVGRAIHMAEDTPMWDEYSNGDKARAWSDQPGAPGSRRPYERLANAFAVLLTNPGAPLVYYGDEIGLPGAGDPDNRRMLPWSGLSSDQRYLRERVQALLRIRAAHPALRRGARETLSVGQEHWLYVMRAGGDQVYVAINRGDADLQVDRLPSAALTELVEDRQTSGPGAMIPPRQARVFIERR